MYAVLRVFCWISVYIQYLILLLLNELAIYYVSVFVLIGVGNRPLGTKFIISKISVSYERGSLTDLLIFMEALRVRSNEIL